MTKSPIPMPRQKTTATLPAEPDLDQDRIDNAMVVMRADAKADSLALAQHNERLAALAAQLKYAGATDPGTLENSARETIRRIGMGIFELGAYLLLLREACEHGTFLPTLDRLGLGPDSAQRYMAVTRRFASNAVSNRLLETSGVSKLVELLPLNDDQVEDLIALGQTGELKLDNVASMSVKELRAAVRELRLEKHAKDRLLQVKAQTIDGLSLKLDRIAQAPPNERREQLHQEAARRAFAAQAAVVGNLRLALQALRDDENASGQGDSETVFMAGLVGSVIAEAKKLLDQFNLPDMSAAADAELAAEVAQWAGKP